MTRKPSSTPESRPTPIDPTPSDPESVFELAAEHADKDRPELIAADAAHFAHIARTLHNRRTELAHQLETTLAAGARGGQAAFQRDATARAIRAELHLLQRYGIDLCLGRMTVRDGDEPRGAAQTSTLYVGRIGLRDDDGTPLLVNWRSDAAGPFFSATRAAPGDVVSRRRFRWRAGRICDYSDELLDAQAAPPRDVSPATLDAESAFLSGLDSARTGGMRDVLGTIQADQDAIIRMPAEGQLVVSGGPGTGKTVVALHRAAHLLYANPRIRERGLVVIGPSHRYIDFIEDVLPGLGEEGVRLVTLSDLVPRAAGARPEDSPEVARLKGDARMVATIEPAIGLYEEPPADVVEVDTPWGEVVLGPAEWRAAFAAVPEGTAHNAAHDDIWTTLAELASAQLGSADPGYDERDTVYFNVDLDRSTMFGGEDAADDAATVESSLRADPGLASALRTAWPILDPHDIVGDLWRVPAYLRMCAPHLDAQERAALHREAGDWTTSDVPILDAAWARIGDPDAANAAERARAQRRAQRARMSSVVDTLIAGDDSEMQVMSMLRGADLAEALASDGAADSRERAGWAADPRLPALGHIVLDEAQELTEAQWLMVARRARSLTIAGDRAQARTDFPETWEDRLARVGLADATVRELGVNYRTPREAMAAASAVIATIRPDAATPTSVRSTGRPVRRGSGAELPEAVRAHVRERAGRSLCVVAAAGRGAPEWFTRLAANSPAGALTWMDPTSAKGLEFDSVIVLDPDAWPGGTAGVVDRYVAMTRTTGDLTILGGDAG